MKYMINGEEVDYIDIDTSEDKINIVYYEKFDIVTAHTYRIESKLKNKHINATICKDLYHGYIGIFLENVEDYIGILHILKIPMNACQIDTDNKFLLIRINEIPKYHNRSFKEIMKKSKD